MPRIIRGKKMKKINIGICGAGTILDAYAPAIAANIDRCTVKAICVTSKAKYAERIHEKLGNDVLIYESWEEMFARPDLDAVIINLPHDLHMPATIAAAKAGKHVLCEKVMARNIEECQAMIDACDDAGVSLVIGHDRRYFPEWKALKEIIDSGKLGRILFYKLEHNQNVIFPKNSWVYKSERLGGGAIMSCLTHQIDTLRWFDGEIDTLACLSVTDPERMEGECIGTITAMMKSGALATLSINWNTTSNRTRNGLWYEFIHVCGTDGEAYYMSNKGTFYKIHDDSDKAIFDYALPETKAEFIKVEPSETGASHTILLTEWLKSLGGEPADIRTFGTDCIHTVEAAQAAYMSRDNKIFVKLPLK
jgi:UDP-N-acetyl-2-amino-2-deoxyglucuronate dehydrogenase